MTEAPTRTWVEAGATAIAEHAERELEALVGVSSPSGDAAGAEETIAIIAALLPPAAAVERIPCSSEANPDDLLASVRGEGNGRLLLLGHIDTVVQHAAHRPLERLPDRLVGSGAVDMKGGIVLALGVMRALSSQPWLFGEIALLAVTDEEWRRGDLAHGDRFAGWDACLCFEGGESGAGGEAGVIVRRKAAGTLRVMASGAAAHSGSAPDAGRNALLALAATAERVAAHNDPAGSDRLTAVPTIIRCGEAFNVVPAAGELVCDLRADDLGAFEPVLVAARAGDGRVALEAELIRRWPAMDTRASADQVLARAQELLGRPVLPTSRGGASDASHIARHIPVTVDGLGPLGGHAHAPDEFVLRASLRPQAEVALAVAVAALT